MDPRGTTRRLWAALALLAPAAMVALAVAALAGEVAVAGAAVALILLGSAAGWVALTNRGAPRLIAALLALAALAGLVAVVASHPRGLLVIVGLAVLVALFGFAARRSLGEVGDRRAATVARRTPGGGASEAVLIINLRSGGGKAERLDLAGHARRRGIEPVVLTPGEDLLALAENAVERGARMIGMAGGDGSQALVATVASRAGVPHVCIPAGTRNHFALDLGLDRGDVVGALDAYLDGHERRVDLASVNGRVFVNNASLGVYAKVVQSDEYRDAKLRTWTRVLPDLLGPDAGPIDLEFDGPDGERCDAPLVLVSNNPYELTHLAGAGTRARMDTGLLGVVAARVYGAADVSRLVALQLAGQVERFPGLLRWSAAEFEVRSSGPVEVGLDGEALVLEPPLRFVSMPGALRVLVPRAAGLSPAARAVSLSAHNLRLLAGVAAGREID